MPVDYIPYYPQPIEGQAVLDNFTRTRRLLAYRDNDKALRHIARGMPSYELQTIETVGQPPAPPPPRHGELRTPNDRDRRPAPRQGRQPPHPRRMPLRLRLPQGTGY